MLSSGLATGSGIEGLLSPVTGDQLNDVNPLPLISTTSMGTGWPARILVSFPIQITGGGVTVMTTAPLCKEVQPLPSVTVKLYVVVANGSFTPGSGTFGSVK